MAFILHLLNKICSYYQKPLIAVVEISLFQRENITNLLGFIGNRLNYFQMSAYLLPFFQIENNIQRTKSMLPPISKYGHRTKIRGNDI